ncbi:hypothetical protein LZ30DRAFT_42606 [Colletotrichum cereale]|nr:hypothetical protein LZ30DRAFT_42606 [Colletotrichum cereale]
MWKMPHGTASAEKGREEPLPSAGEEGLHRSPVGRGTMRLAFQNPLPTCGFADEPAFWRGRKVASYLMQLGSLGKGRGTSLLADVVTVLWDVSNHHTSWYGNRVRLSEGVYHHAYTPYKRTIWLLEIVPGPQRSRHSIVGCYWCLTKGEFRGGTGNSI